MAKHTAIYVRVSSKGQSVESQLPDLEAWEAAHKDTRVVWYRDKFTGKTMERPGWKELEDKIVRGQVDTIVVWRLDRLGRTTVGLTALFELLQKANVNLVSLRDGTDLSTPAGRLLANVLASVAQYETEVRAERQAAGIAIAKAKGKVWWLGKKHGPTKMKGDKVELLKIMWANRYTQAKIARTLGVSRFSVSRCLKRLGFIGMTNLERKKFKESLPKNGEPMTDEQRVLLGLVKQQDIEYIVGFDPDKATQALVDAERQMSSVANTPLLETGPNTASDAPELPCEASTA